MHTRAVKNVRILHDAGVLIATVTDSGAMPTGVVGFDEHCEPRLLVEAGLTPMQSIFCGTSHRAEVIGQSKERGVMRQGWRADLVALSANSLDDTHSTSCIAPVLNGGEMMRSTFLWRLRNL